MTYYTMKQACELTGFSYDTLKFYCNVGLIPDVQRDAQNHRIFDDDCIEWIKNLNCLKRCGMSIDEMKTYVRLCQADPDTIPERQRMLDTKLADLHQKIDDLNSSITFIHNKQQFYQDVLAGKRPYITNLKH